jgi:hypothetical protein
MNGPLAMIFVVLVIILGIGSVWAITARGASAGPITDSFGNTQNASIIAQNNQTAGIAVSTMPIIYLAFIIAVCVVIVIGLVWLWNTGKSKSGKY